MFSRISYFFIACISIVIVAFFMFSALPTFAQSGDIPIRTNYCGSQGCPIFGDVSDIQGQEGIASIILRIANFLIYLAGAVAVVFIIVGGYYMIVNPSGDSKKLETGRKILTGAIVGLILVLVAYTIVTLVSTLVTSDLFSIPN